MRHFLSCHCLAFALAISFFPCLSNADLVTFNLEADSVDSSTITQTVNGLTVTFSNATFLGVGRDFVQDGDGLAVLDGPGGFGNEVDRFEMTFDQDVALSSYIPGFVAFQMQGDESLRFEAGDLSIESNFVDEALTEFSNQFTVSAGKTIVVTADFGADNVANLVQFRRLTVNRFASVPEPSLTAIGIITGMGLIARRRRRAIFGTNEKTR